MNFIENVPFVVILAIFGILAGFFRSLLVKVVVVLAAEIVLFVMFPNLLVKFAQLIGAIRAALG